MSLKQAPISIRELRSTEEYASVRARRLSCSPESVLASQCLNALIDAPLLEYQIAFPD
jgi:hypothetical protein